MEAAPSGTVTLLFTDIEGSTRLLESSGERYADLLAVHHRLLRSAFAAHGGYEVDSAGDAFFAVFPAAKLAVAAASQAQHALAEYEWPSGEGINVRMGLHTGEPRLVDGNYVGIDVHRAARVMAAGHGGQVLISQSTRELLEAEMPLRDLGEHRLKDLSLPQRIYQLVIPGLQSEFLNTLENRPTNLPVQPTPLIGRVRQLDEVAAMLGDPGCRLITLTGAGGTGKTRLALQTAANLIDGFPAGWYFVSLAPLSDAALTIPTIAQTLGLRERPGEALLETLIDHLRGKALLLVLDNMEQITDAAPEIARLVLEAASLKVLVTSRAPLQIAVEQLYPVPALRLPELADLPDLDTLSQYEAIRLFLARAQAADPEFAITNENAPAIAEICVRVDGLPLAVELAAARVNVLSPQAMLTRLDQRLKLLISGRQDQHARQRTLRATIAWSYDLLSSEERLLFMRLAAFVGGSRIDAAVAVCDPDGRLDLDVLDGLASLVDKSLLRKRDDPDGEPRFWMLETIHEYARERLEASSELEATLERHAAYYSGWLLDVAPLMPVPYNLSGGLLVAQEQLNLRELLQRLETQDRDDELLQVVACIWWSMYFRGLLSEARTWLERAVGGRGSDLRWRTFALAGIVNCAARQGDLDAAVAAAEAELAAADQLGDDGVLVSAWRDLALARSFGGDLDGGEECLRQSIQIAEATGDKYGRSAGLSNLAHIALARGEYRHAIEITSEAAILASEVGDSYQQAICAYNTGSALLRLGEIADAERHFSTALELVLDLEFLEGIAYPLSALAMTAAYGAEWERAVRLFGAAAALTDRAGLVFDPLEQSERERALKQARSHLGPADYDERYAAWRALLTEHAIADALRHA